MNRDDKVLAVYPPHPEEGASTCAAEKHNVASRPSRRMGRPHGSRRRARGLRNLGGPKIAAPHHEAGRDRECIKLIGIRFSAADLKFLHHLKQTLLGTSNREAALES